ncbi:uncharacterized protein LOC126666610 isoform X2 [Mercurialis annua]|uniref:uncharacterized protein LOC126666610 isoform X2 n=1 Tax=Mercurialis annua TaxID=3986 RepID=UPI0021608E17|nr:uncharacterized protein LOC126666610 isoform X2 [Mercurialis annua]
MGRLPSNGGPTFRFLPTEIREMESILQEYHYGMPDKEVLVNIAEKFSESPDRKGKVIIQMKQVWSWFQNKRYAVRAKASKAPVILNVTPISRVESTQVRNVPQPRAASIPAPITAAMTTPSGNDARSNTNLEEQETSRTIPQSLEKITKAKNDHLADAIIEIAHSFKEYLESKKTFERPQPTGEEIYAVVSQIEGLQKVDVFSAVRKLMNGNPEEFYLLKSLHDDEKKEWIRFLIES